MAILGIFLVMLLAYLLGSVPTAYLVVKDEILRKGTGNIGAMNVYRVLKDKKGNFIAILAFLLVMAVDAGKGALAFLVAKWFLFFGYEPFWGFTLAAFCAVLGHGASIYMKWRKGQFYGGRALATLWGIVFVVNWILALLCLGIMIMAIIIAEFVINRKVTWKKLPYILGHQLPGRISGIILCLILLYFFSYNVFCILIPSIGFSLYKHNDRLTDYLKKLGKAA